MRIESALYTSREGINAHGGAISVVGDNIANSNTTGYKTQRSEFSDLVADNGSAPETIPTAGNGVSLDRVRVMFEQGLVETTGRSLDAAVSGSGFFIVGTEDNPFYTRDGVFEFGEDGTLQTRDGLQVLGTPAGQEGGVLAPLDSNVLELGGQATTEVTIRGNLGSGSEVTDGLPGANELDQNDLNALTTFNSPVEVYDSLGNRRTLQLAYFKTGPNEWTVRAYANGADIDGEDGTVTQVGELELNFDNTGVIPEADQENAVLNVNVNWGDGAAAGAFTVDFGDFTQYATASQLRGMDVNGQSAGEVQTYSFTEGGALVAQLDNGEIVEIGTLQLATFESEDGLDRAGESLFRATERTGDVVIGNPGDANAGSIQGSAVERSTVDISKEFVDLVLLQRGYQANSKVLSETSGLIEETISLIR